MVIPIKQKELKSILKDKGISVVVGMYGSGKSLVVKWVQDHFENLIHISFKDLPKPTNEDICLIAGFRSFAQLHAKWRAKAEKSAKKGKVLTILIEEAQQAADSYQLWEAIASLLYYQKGKIQFILTAQPAVLEASDFQIRNVLYKNTLFPRRLTEYETSSLIVNKFYSKQIYKYSRGHYGTVKYLDQLISKNKFEGERLTESKIVKWAKEEGKMPYFASIIWRGLSQSQQLWVRQFVNSRGKVETKSSIAYELKNCGLWSRGGRQIKWFVPWTLPFVRDYLQSIPVDVTDFTRLKLGRIETKIVEALKKKAGKVATYDELWQVGWGNKSNFSLWAISRMMSRLRKKLQQIGHGGMLNTARGLGYYLNNSD